ncbi:MAG: protoporphyrinogen oxidase [Planctomycetota bacterium]
MPENSSPGRETRQHPRVAVIGAGITGLAAAVRLADRLPGAELAVFEAADRPGGVLQTVRRGGYLIERSADNFLAKEPWATDFCRRVGIADGLLPTDQQRRKALVVRDGRVVPAPQGFVLMQPKRLGTVLRSPVLSWRGKLRLACEPCIPRRRAAGDESVASFARRRLGREAFERLVQPLLAGIYTADPEKLSMAATMPQFVEQEQSHGSLCRAAWREAREANNAAAESESRESGARYGLFLAPREGIGQLVEAAAAQLAPGVLRVSSPVESITPDDGGWVVAAAGAAAERFDAVVLTTPAHHAAEVVARASPTLAAKLAEIEYAGCSVVGVAYLRSQVAAELPGFGFVVPAVEGRRVIAVSFSSLKFPGRAPDGQVLMRAFVGGALQPGLAELPDEELHKLVREELRALLGVIGNPLETEIARWPRGMPQYHLGHLDHVDQIESLVAKLPGLELAGAAYRGVGVPQCIHGGEQAAERVADSLAAGRVG